MKKLFLMLFVLGSLSVGFSSCGSDEDEPEKPDLTMRDLSPLAGNYVGTRTVTTSSEGQKPVVNSASIVRLITAASADQMMMETSELGIINKGDMLRNFEYTSELKDACKFTSGGYSTEGLTEKSIPDFVTTWYGGLYKEIKKVDRNLENTTATFDFATKKLVFEYKGTVMIYATTLDDKGAIVDVKREINILYKYEVTKTKE